MAAITANMAISLRSELTKPVKVEYLDGNLFSMDNAGNTIHVYTFYDGEPQEISGSISANVIRADGSTVAVSGAKEGNRAYVILPQAAYAVPGVCTIVVKATDSTTVTTIAALVANVYMSSTDTPVDPGTIIPSVQNLIAAIDAAIASIPADYSSLISTIAQNYSSNSIYPTVGTIVWYNGELVQNKVPILTAETYDPDKWESSKVGKYLTTNANNIQLLANSFGRATNITPIFFERGFCYLTKATGEIVPKSASTSYACALVPVVEGDKITINATGSSGSDYRLYVFIDAEGKSMGRVAASLTGERTIEAPAGAVYCAINNRIATQPDGYYAYKGTAVIDSAAEKRYNSADLLRPVGTYRSTTASSTLEFTYNERTETFHAEGTADSTTYNVIFSNPTMLIPGVVPGNDYFVTCKSTNPANLYVEVWLYFNGATSNPTNNIFREDGIISVPSNTTGMIYRIRVKNGATVNADISNLTLKNAYTNRELTLTANDQAGKVSSLLSDIVTKAPAIVEQGSGTTINFDDGGDMPFKSCYATIAPKQLGTGDASPENIREIKGFTKYNITVAGENLFGGETMLKGVKASIPGATVNESAGTIAFTHVATVSGQYPYITDFCGLTGKFKAGTQYTFVLTLSKSSGTGSNIAVVYTDGTAQAIVGVSGTEKQVLAFTTMGGTGSAAKTVKGIRKYDSSGTTTLYYNECAVLEGTSGYQRPYKGKMYEVELPAEAGTVYGGSLLVRADGSGTLTVDRGMYVFDGASKIMTVAESSSGIMCMRSNFLSNLTSGNTQTLSNQYSRMIASGSPTEGTAIRITDSIFVYDNRFADLATATAICEANPIQVCYVLATPITYEFTPGQIKSILGENNVWAENGDMSVQYCADTKLYIDAAIAAALNP